MTAEKLAAELMLAAREHVSLLAMEVLELRERRGLLSKSELRAHHEAHPPAENWDVDGVVNAVSDAGLGAYAARFAAAQIDGPRLLQLEPHEISHLIGGTRRSEVEEEEAAAELLHAMIGHLRWQAAQRLAASRKEEL